MSRGTSKFGKAYGRNSYRDNLPDLWVSFKPRDVVCPVCRAGKARMCTNQNGTRCKNYHPARRKLALEKSTGLQ